MATESLKVAQTVWRSCQTAKPLHDDKNSDHSLEPRSACLAALVWQRLVAALGAGGRELDAGVVAALERLATNPVTGRFMVARAVAVLGAGGRELDAGVVAALERLATNPTPTPLRY